MEFRVLDVEHVVEHRVELVLERSDDALERHHLLADDRDPGSDHASEIVTRARRDAATHRTVERRVVQYERAANAAHDEHGRGQEVQTEPVHGERNGTKTIMSESALRVKGGSVGGANVCARCNNRLTTTDSVIADYTAPRIPATNN